MNIELLRTRMVSYFQNMSAEDLVEKYKKLGYSFTESPEPSPTVAGKESRNYLKEFVTWMSNNNYWPKNEIPLADIDQQLSLLYKFAAASPVGGMGLGVSIPLKKFCRRVIISFVVNVRSGFNPLT